MRCEEVYYMNIVTSPSNTIKTEYVVNEDSFFALAVIGICIAVIILVIFLTKISNQKYNEETETDQEKE